MAGKKRQPHQRDPRQPDSGQSDPEQRGTDQIQAESLVIKLVGWGAAASVAFAGWLIGGAPPIDPDSGTIGRFSFEHAATRSWVLVIAASCGSLIWASAVWILVGHMRRDRFPGQLGGRIRALCLAIAACNVGLAIGVGHDDVEPISEKPGGEEGGEPETRPDSTPEGKNN